MLQDVYYLTYTSTITLWGAINPFTFKKIEKASKINNGRKRIKGFLLFKDGRFFQYIEGNRSDIEQLYQTLLKDVRHKNLKVTTTGQRPNYLFNHWDMYCFNINTSDTIHPISELFKTFDSYQWRNDNVEQLVKDMHCYHDKDKLK